ncbi:MAG: hypothetical protein IPO19_12565 [Rhodoferax sp.]|nr:hypothetical protein [Rhodoferax sp.]
MPCWSGAVMLGGIITNKSPVDNQTDADCAASSEDNVFVLPASSPFKTMAEVVDNQKTLAA